MKKEHTGGGIAKDAKVELAGAENADVLLVKGNWKACIF